MDALVITMCDFILIRNICPLPRLSHAHTARIAPGDSRWSPIAKLPPSRFGRDDPVQTRMAIPCVSMTESDESFK
jgi:hypothetical protein